MATVSDEHTVHWDVGIKEAEVVKGNKKIPYSGWMKSDVQSVGILDAHSLLRRRLLPGWGQGYWRPSWSSR